MQNISLASPLAMTSDTNESAVWLSFNNNLIQLSLFQVDDVILKYFTPDKFTNLAQIV